MAKIGTATISLKEYDMLQEIKKNYFEIMNVCQKAVELNAQSINESVEEGKKYFITEAFIPLHKICDVTGWAMIEIDKINRQNGLNKIERMNKIDGHQE